jgi:hypothetical protein
MSARKRILWWVIVAFSIVVISHIAGKTTKKEYSPTIYHAKGQHYVAASKADMQKAIEYKTHKDSAAIATLFREGKLFHLRPGAEVYRLSTTFAGLVKIRPKGSTEELWTYREEIDE